MYRQSRVLVVTMEIMGLLRIFSVIKKIDGHGMLSSPNRPRQAVSTKTLSTTSKAHPENKMFIFRQFVVLLFMQ